MRLLALLLVSSVCGSASAQSSIPGTEQEAIALVNAMPTCTEWKRMSVPQRPVYPSICVRSGLKLPPFMDEHDIGGKCTSLFDLSPAGQPVNVRATCVLKPENPVSADVLKVAQAAMLRLYERELSEEREYAAFDPGLPDEKRTDLSHWTQWVQQPQEPSFELDDVLVGIAKPKES